MIIIILIKFIYVLIMQIKQNINISFEKSLKISIEHHKDSKVYTDYSNNTQDVYKNIKA